MRLGLRVRLLALLALLMLLMFWPLKFAILTYVRVGFEQQEQRAAERLARSVSAHLATFRAGRTDDATLHQMSLQVQGGAVQAIFLCSSDGKVLARTGALSLTRMQGERCPKPETLRVRSEGGADFLEVTVRAGQGTIATLTRLRPTTGEAEQVARLLALYLGMSGLGLLFSAYFALTRWMVRPVVELEEAARRVAEGGQKLGPPTAGPREIIDLWNSLSIMTQKLRRDEEALRLKVIEVETATLALKKAQSSLVQSERMASVGRLSAGLAHEIGNPISALMGFTELLLEGGLSREEERDFLTRMKREIARIHRVLGDLLAFSRPQKREKGRVPSARASIEHAVEDVFSLLRPQKDFRAIRLEKRLDPELPLVPMTQEELVQVLLNLTVNAASALEHQGVISIEAQKLESGLELVVVDDGPGVDPSIRESLFEPFVSTKEVGNGTGLGLAVSRGLVEAARATIALDTDYRSGARFVITWPAEALVRDESTRPPSPA